MSSNRTPVYPRRTVVRTATLVGMTQHVLSVQLVVQRMEPAARLLLRFGMERRL